MGTYTQRPETEIDVMVEGHLRMAVDEIRRRAPDLHAIYLSGGFGGGEGTVRRTADGWVPCNDYDFVVIGTADASRREAAVELGRRLASVFRIEYVDIGWLQAKALPTASPTIENFDFKEGARLLHGEEIRGLMPKISADQISRFELVRLICNRAAGLHTTFLPAWSGDRHYASLQALKAWQAAGDVMVSVMLGYSPRCAARCDSFRQLVDQSKLPVWFGSVDATRVIQAYESKLGGWTDVSPVVGTEGLGTLLAEIFRWLVATDGGEADLGFPQAVRRARRKYAGPRKALWRDVGRMIKRRHLGYLAGDQAFISLHVLLAQGAVAAARDRGVAAERAEYLRQFWWVPGAWGQPFNGAGTARLWEHYTHG